MIELTWARAGWWSGRLRVADAHASTAVALAEEAQDATVLAPALAQAATVAFHLGRPEWTALVERGITIEPEVERALPLESLPRMYRALGYERLGDDLDVARMYLLEVRALALERGDHRALAVLGIPLCATECSAGNLELAAAHAREGAAYAAEAEAFHLEGSYKYAFALVDAYTGGADEALAGAQEALALEAIVLTTIALLCRALLARGVVARRAKHKREAEHALGRALEVFERTGIRLLADRARTERARIGLRPRAPSELTETEQQVAELAAAGRRNGEITAQLFMSVRAVEANLTRAYRKLEVRSRAELASRLGPAART